MRARIYILAIFFLMAGLTALTSTSCRAPEPIRVGFVAGLTGANAALGVDGRDGALLAVEQINTAGGIGKRPIELLVRDDLGTPEGALAADAELIEQERLPVIIGHMTSGTMVAAWDKFQNSGVIFLSPTVSTPQLSGMDDNFFRLIVVNSFVADRLAVYAAADLGLRKIAVFYDIDNASYTETYQLEFGKAFTANGGSIIATHAFSSQTAPNFKNTLSELKAEEPDGLFIVGSASDTALIAQQARLAGLDAQLLATNWSLTGDLIENGGAAVDGIIAVVSHNENNQTTAYLDFAQRFQERFGRQPTFAAGYGYEAVQVLAAALRQTDGTTAGLADALSQTQNFTGVHGQISFDPFGDVSRTLYLIAVRDGKFFTAQTFPAP